MIRSTCGMVLIALLPVTLSADDSDSTLRFYLSKAKLVIACDVLDQLAGLVTEAGVTNYICQIRVLSVLHGSVDEEKLRVNVVRFDGTGGIPKQVGKYILFLRSVAPDKPAWETADFWFGIMDYHERTATALKRVAQNMHDEARWQPLRDLRGTRDKHIPKLIALADGKDKEVALAAMSQLSNYKRNPDIVAFLRRKMKDADPQLALQVSRIGCSHPITDIKPRSSVAIPVTGRVSTCCWLTSS